MSNSETGVGEASLDRLIPYKHNIPDQREINLRPTVKREEEEKRPSTGLRTVLNVQKVRDREARCCTSNSETGGREAGSLRLTSYKPQGERQALCASLPTLFERKAGSLRLVTYSTHTGRHIAQGTPLHTQRGI